MQPGARARTARTAKSVCTSYVPPTLLQSLLQYNFPKVEQKEKFSIVSSSTRADSSPTLSITGHVRLFRFFSDFLLKVMDGGSGPLPAACLLPT